MKLKNGILLIGCFLLITGCSDTSFQSEKLPFLGKATSDQKAVTNGSPKVFVNRLSLESVYFNNISVVDGKSVIQNPTNVLALVNKHFFLPSTYIPNDLVRPNVEFSFTDLKLEKAYLRKEAALALEKMFKSANNSGIELVAVSGYRSYSRQKNLFDSEVNHVGTSQAEQAVAVPGSSEHQTGLAMDIAGKNNYSHLTDGFANTKEGKWLAENAHLYGFILRYPKGKEELTHYEYEPWHFRYVGVKAAAAIYKHNWTLEEYFQQVKKI
jgi:D-alanyl-D-alanine carboxypeptidase